MRAITHQKTGIKLVLILILAVGLCITSCGMAEQHGSTGSRSILCTVDLPKVFQVVILMNVLLFALSTLVVVPQAPAFSLFKPPRFTFF
ncbi:MAG: hypothetical protein KGL31_13375 [candidate division NC10 bacterium]|nr:hypothetical protein [candidate division NC10 bacterium]